MSYELRTAQGLFFFSSLFKKGHNASALSSPSQRTMNWSVPGSMDIPLARCGKIRIPDCSLLLCGGLRAPRHV